MSVEWISRVKKSTHALLALLIISNTIIENSPRVALVESVAPKEIGILCGDDLQNEIGYDQVASIISSSDAPTEAPISEMKAYTATLRNVNKDYIAELKNKPLVTDVTK